MRRLPSLLLVLLVLSSGCAGFLPWSDSGSTRDASTTTSSASLSPPPGANGQWIFDSERLISAHESALESRNYRVTARIRPKQDVGSARWMNSTLVAHVGDGRVRIREAGERVVMNDIGNPYRGYAWNDSEARCLRGAERCQSRSERTPNLLRQRIGTVAPRMQNILSSADFLAKGTTVRNGTRLYRYEASGSTSLADVETLSATVLVDERGIIHDLSGTVRTTGTRSATVEFSYGYELVSNPPTSPKWMDGRPRLTVRKNASEFTVEHHGGERVPAGTNVSLILGNDTVGVSGDVTLPKPLGNGDVAHITVTDIEDTNSNLNRVVGNATVNRPPSSEPGIDHADWTIIIRLRTEKWRVFVRNTTTSNESVP
ncbi:hypothetical protein [Haladaptatus sp. CMAA 1911]|uniref:hypothetical protein n=1 Tax=unclassified Haladaptatus TaxID=2622732 RepID=UPI00375536AA